MHYRKIIIVAFLVLSGLGCSQNQDLKSKLIGRWDMAQVFEYGKDVTDKHNPNGNRYIVFKEDGSFLSDGDPFGKNTGRWSVREKSILSIDSDVDDDDSEWQVTFNGDDEVSWTGIGHARKQNTKLVHRRNLH